MHSPLSEPLLFLDFDGVLHANDAPPPRRFERAGALVALLQRWPGLTVVVSSSWRLHHSWPALLDSLPRALAARLDTRTGAAVVGRYARHREIVDCWRLLGDRRPWRALDDAAWEFPPHCEQLIACDGARGVQQAQLDELECWLIGLSNLECALGHIEPRPAPEQMARTIQLLQGLPARSPVSVAWLQRELRLGYREAVRVLAETEGELLSPMDSEGRRWRL
ncbi:MAG TPA: HAD domain-containing protein [Roseateles sp.]